MNTHERVTTIKVALIKRRISQTEISRIARKDVRRVSEVINGKFRNTEIEAILTRVLGLNPEIWDNDGADCTE